ncbi:hypothetical protein CEXT_805861 [Caerostris extrusa]|uniref:Uncharacterized protein n=1 Tax=Caerostris extrusa TaxID=172846 RepID=A0AAV4Y5K4_CAEEX|nr:hypothetical protein CEXT_805861 [Caerostris extrusa]
MDVSPPGDDEQPPYRLPPGPPVNSDEFLYLHVETITKIIELKAKLLADWFRPKGLDPESASKLDKEYDATTAEMLALCEVILSPSQSVECLRMNYQITYSLSMRRSNLPIFVCTRKPLPHTRKNFLPRKEKDPWMPRAIKSHQSILYAKILQKNLKICGGIVKVA